MTHDPTFDAVSAAEERGCKECIWRAETWGLVHCIHPEKEPHQRPEGLVHMRGCLDWETSPWRKA